MPKNIFFISFFYVFIACMLFLASTVHSAPTNGQVMIKAGVPASNTLQDQVIADEY